MRTRTAVRGVASLLGGAVVFAAGAGLGPPHVAKAGWSIAAVVGLAGLLIGLAVTIHGAAVLLRSTPRLARFVLVPALVVVVGLIVYTVAQPVAATNVPPTSLGRSTPAAKGVGYRDVTFPTSDGVELSGWYIPTTNGAAVTLLHGSGSTRSAVLDHAAVLARAGYGVLLYDARGHGRSDGRAMDFGWWGDRDVAGAVSFLVAQRGVDPGRIGAVGLSMGGEEAIGAAAADPRIAAVVAEGATNRTAADKAWLSDEFGARGAFQELVERVLYGITGWLTPAPRPTPLAAAAAAAAPRPMLLVAAGKVADEGHVARFVQRASPDSVDVWVVPGAGHTDGLSVRRAEWERRVVGFLDDALRG